MFIVYTTFTFLVLVDYYDSTKGAYIQMSLSDFV